MVDARDLAEVAAYLDEHHRDTLLLIACTLVGRSEARRASMVSVDRAGCVVVTSDVVPPSSGRTRSHRIDFEQPATTIDEVRSALFALVVRARQLDATSAPATSLEAVVADTERQHRQRASVRTVCDLVPGIREITLTTTCGVDTVGGDEYLRITTPATGGSALYTVRRARPELREIDIWFVLHGEGATSRWAASAAPGDHVGVDRTARAYHPPTDTTRIVMVGDRTGLAAFARILDETPTGLPVVIVADVDGLAASLVPIDRPATTVHLIDSDRSGDDLTSTLRSLVDYTSTTYYFGAGELRDTANVKRYLRDELGVARNRMMVTGYWRRDWTARSATST
jgi:NADPH-dependent ferric siderophore reductase